MILTLPQIEGKIREFAAIMNAPEEFIPTFGSSNQTGLPHIEISNGHYTLIVCEKGKEFSRESFDNFDDLVFKVVQDISFSMACERVFEDTNDQSYRERFFQVQKHILSKIDVNHNEKVKLYQESLTTEDTSALSESRKKILLKSNNHKTPLQSRVFGKEK